MTNKWSDRYTELLKEILDQLIPANPEKRIPAAGEAGVVDFVALSCSDDEFAFTSVNTLLGHAAEMNSAINAEMVQQLEKSNSQYFAVLLKLAYMGYYSRPEIRSLIGLASHPIHPKGYEVPLESTQLIEKLTAPVVARGPFYRESKNKVKEQSE